MIIRKARLKDVPRIVELWNEFMKSHNLEITKKNTRHIPFLEYNDNAINSFRDFVKKQIYSKNGLLLVAEDFELVGYLLSYIKPNIPIFKIKKLGHLSDLYIKKGYRKKGIATKFRDIAFDWFKEQGIKHVSISVYPENNVARKIYEKWGFFDFHIEMRKEL